MSNRLSRGRKIQNPNDISPGDLIKFIGGSGYSQSLWIVLERIRIWTQPEALARDEEMPLYDYKLVPLYSSSINLEMEPVNYTFHRDNITQFRIVSRSHTNAS